jgi:hypothetical protein
MKQTSKILSYFAFPALVFLIHLITVGLSNLYIHFPHIDIPFHYAGGFAIAFTSAQILTYLEEEKITSMLNRVLFVIMIIALTTTAAVIWEFAEFISDQFLHTDLQGSIANTMQDQFVGILGGATWAFIYSRKLLR